MSKSKGAVLTVSVLQEKGYDPLVYRFFCLQSHYRKPLEFSFEALDQAATAFNKLVKRVSELKNEGEVDEKVKKDLEAGKVHVFDTSTFTVKGKKLDSYKADVDTDKDYKKDTEVIKDGYFHESEFRSAPYFDIQIDGIKLLDTAF